MTRSIRIVEPASAELAEAVRWYEAHREGLGAELLDAVAGALDVLAAYPEIGSAFSGIERVRRLPLRRFPYQIVYRFTDPEVVVVAIAHAKRRPGYWQDRI